METTTFSQIVYQAYIPFLIALTSITLPVVTALLSVFSEGREQVTRQFQDEVGKLTKDIGANEIVKKNSFLRLSWELMKKNYFLILLNPSHYIVLFTAPPLISAISVIAAIHQYRLYLSLLSAFFLLVFFFFLSGFIKLLAEITSLVDGRKNERERSMLEAMQNLLKTLDPASQYVKNIWLTINGTRVHDHDSLPSATLGKESSWKVSFNNSENLAAKKTEIGIQLPVGAFEIIKQTGYNVYEAENITRFYEEYIQKKTNRVFTPPLKFIPKRTGEHEIVAWLKGENVETQYFTLKISVEIEA